jgi:hypothetical protein
MEDARGPLANRGLPFSGSSTGCAALVGEFYHSTGVGGREGAPGCSAAGWEQRKYVDGHQVRIGHLVCRAGENDWNKASCMI